MSRSDNVGMFWDDTPPPKPLPKEKIKRGPPPKAWLEDDFLPYLEEALAFNVNLFTDAELMQAQKDKEQLVFDIECYPNYFLIAFKSVQSRKVVFIESLDDSEMELNKFKWIMENFCIVSFNGNFYDMPIAAIALAGNSCATMKYATMEIIEQNERAYKMYKKYGVKEVAANHIDIREVLPLTGSLKAYGGRVHTRKLQDLPFDPDRTLRGEQAAIVRLYCINDLDQTIELFLEVEDKIKLRSEMSIQYGVDLRSKSDAQIAEAVISSELTKIFRKRLKRPTVSPGKIYKYKPPAYMQFISPTMQWVFDRVKSADFVIGDNGSVIMPPELLNLQVKIADGVYRMGIGGLHSSEKCATHYTNSYAKLEDDDVESFYPRIILNQRLYPQHLGPTFLKVYNKIVTTRIAAKKAGQTSISDSLKIVINGSFGKLGSPYSILYSPDLLIQVTVTGQLSLLMLIERMELAGIPVVSANTDGLVTMCPIDKLELKALIIEEWEKETCFVTERSEYAALHSRDVNNYLAVKLPNKDNVVKIKTKGAYSDAGLSKNPTNTICVDAVKEFLITGCPLEDTIRNATDFTKFLTVRNVKGGAVPLDKLPYDENASAEEMTAVLQDNGWQCYHGSWVLTKWIEQKLPYERMAWPIADAYKACRPVTYGTYLGKVIRWYYSTDARERSEIVYAGSGNKVPRSEGAKAVMELPSAMPADIDYEWYINEAEEILISIGHTQRKVEEAA